MPAKLLEILSAWFLLSLIVGLLVGSTVPAFQGESPAPGFAPYAEREGDETLALAHAQMQGVKSTARILPNTVF
jgi:hypothetical protein